MTMKRLGTIFFFVTITAMVDLHLFSAGWAARQQLRAATRTYNQNRGFIALMTNMTCDGQSKARRPVVDSRPCSPQYPDRIERSIERLREKKGSTIIATVTGSQIVALVHHYGLKLETLSLAPSDIEIKTDGPINPTLAFLRALSIHREPIVPHHLKIAARTATAVDLDWRGSYLAL